MRRQDSEVYYVRRWQAIDMPSTLTIPSCIAYKDECHYDKPPSLAYVRSLEEEIHEMRLQLRQFKTQAWLSKVDQTSSSSFADAC